MTNSFLDSHGPVNPPPSPSLASPLRAAAYAHRRRERREPDEWEWPSEAFYRVESGRGGLDTMPAPEGRRPQRVGATWHPA
jgi:hypothetical protein